jgi:hypothetical protein
MRRFLLAMGLTCVAVVSLPWLSTPAAADNSDFDQLTDPDADLKALAPKLETIARRLRAGIDVTPVGSLTIVSPGTDSERTAIGERLAGIWRKESEGLRSLGFAPPADPPEMTVIVVRVKGPTGYVRASGGPVLLLRLGETSRAKEPSAVAPRPDGPAAPRDAVAAARATRLWMASVGAGATARSGEAYAFARQVVAASVKRDDLPPWFYEGLVSWTEDCAAQEGASAHFCKPYGTPTPALLAQVLDPKTAASPVGARFLGKFVGVLVEGRMDVASRAGAMGPAGDAKAIESAFGVAADAVLAKTCAGLKVSGACDEKGLAPCPACKGAAKLELSCPDCLGTGALVCPSCRGLDGCPADCNGGFITYESGKRLKCRVCSGGKLKCQACSGAMRSACKSCSGSGKGTWPCLACRSSGRITCPELGSAEDSAEGTACPWCQDAARQAACPDCSGVGYQGCDACGGTLRQLCSGCGGTGEVRMVYTDGTTASATKCDECEGKGWFRCNECKGGRLDCSRCSGKGRGKFKGAGCAGCVDGKLPTLAELRDPAPVRAAAAADGEDAAASDPASEADRVKAMLDRAVEFLLTCNRTKDGAFALRRFRSKNAKEAGELQTPTLFSNAQVLWTLAVVGIGVNDPRTERAWQALRRESQKVIDKTAEWSGTQATGLAIRAFAAAGEDPKSPVVVGLVDRLCKAQHASGWWGSSLDEKDPDDALDSLFALESLRVARSRGVKVPSAVWGKALRAASAEFDTKGPAGMKSDFLGGTSVLSNMALVVMAKEGSLGSKATAFDYASMPAIKKGMAWLERYFDIRKEPAFVRGAAVKDLSDAGYSAYLFAAQRLAMLLSIEVIGGEHWHTTGARYLSTIQHKDGSFEETSLSHLNGPVRTTSSCILFLIRATTPITNVDDDK